MTELFQKGLNIKFVGSIGNGSILYFIDLYTGDHFFIDNDKDFCLQKVIDIVGKIRTV